MHRSIATSGQVKSAKRFLHFISVETMVSWRSKFNLTRFDCHSCIRRRILQLYSSKSIGCFGKYLKWPRSIAKCTMEFKRNCFIQNFILVLGVPLFELNFHNLLNYAPVVSVVLFPRIQSKLMECNGMGCWQWWWVIWGRGFLYSISISINIMINCHILLFCIF